LRVSDELIGKPLACPACGARLIASAPSPVTAVPPAPPPAAVPPPLPQAVPAAPEDLGEVVGVWGLMELISGPNMTVITERAFCVGTLPREEVKQANKRLQAGAPVQQILGPSLRVLPLAAIQAVRLSNKEATLTLGYLEGARRAQLTIQYVQPVQRWVYEALRPRLGRGWHEESIPATAWSAASLPLSVVFCLGLFTTLGFLATRQKESGVAASGRGRMFEVLLGWIPSVACIGIAVLLVLVGAVWTVFAIRHRPPAVLTITRAQPGEG
jgi:hypothetical protein